MKCVKIIRLVFTSVRVRVGIVSTVVRVLKTL